MKQTIVMSVSKGENPYTDIHNGDNFIDELVKAGIEFHLGVGFYKGNVETAFIIKADPYDRVVRKALVTTRQESYIVIDRLGNAWFYYLDTGVEEYGGTWVEIPEEDLHKYDGWTVDLETKKSYTIQPTGL